MLRIKGDDGFVARIDPDKVSAFGIEPGTKEKFFVICADRQYTISQNPRRVLAQFERNFKHGNQVNGFRCKQKELGGSI